MSVLVRLGLLAGLCFSSMSVFSQMTDMPTTPPSAHEIVRDTSDRVMAVVEGAHAYADENPERYYEAVHQILDPVIDYRGFARSVMGPYASKDRYQSLDEAGREQLRQQLDDFTEVMRTGLVRTYGKGLLAFSGSRIEISDPSEEELATSRVTVRQLIFAEEAEPYVVMYQMGKGRGGDWMLRNVIIETVNLGEIYRNQFQSAARKYDGDLDAVINSWSAVEVDS
ncbi:MAG: ABC transporter substrate-binding protein [Halioglobus sp.]